MNFPFYIARRYVFAKKSHNAINLIAAISIVGVAVGTMAFIIILSVFNGFDSVVRELFNTFYADLEIVPETGKTFTPDEADLERIRSSESVISLAQILEENALLMYGGRQTVATVRGVSEEFASVTGMDTMMWEGDYILREGSTPFAIPGRGIKYIMNIELDFFESIKIIAPRRSERISMDPNRALNTKYIQPSGFFSSQPEIESKYVLVPLDFARDLFDYKTEVTALEIRLAPGANIARVQRELQSIVGEGLRVKNRVQQNDLLYKTMRSEKWAIFFILFFILLVASFNVVGTLSMLIIEKKNDIQTLRYLGLTLQNIKRTFLLEGTIISLIGALAGLIIGSTVCLVQQEFGLVKLQGAEAFVIDAYPVRIMLQDFLLVLLSVSAIGFFASWYPVRYITRKYLVAEN